MRNLRNIRFQQEKPPAQFHDRPLTSTTWDLADSDDSLICTFGPTPVDALVELVRVRSTKGKFEYSLITSWDAPSPNPELECDEILNLQYFGDTQTACLVLAGGDIVVVREEPLSGGDRIEIVGSVDVGITAAKWSPDEELLAITTKADTVVFMSRSFEGITDVTMTAEDLKASNHVSVGWGKKETQFHGRGAKALRDPTMPEKVDEGVLSPNDDFEATISWRGDGAFLAVSTIEGGTRRIIRVYSREGVLDSVSEPVDGLEGALSWRPAGNLIAGIQRYQDRVDVVFFERNGLRHGQFSLRLGQDQLDMPDQHIKLIWNADSTVLAVVLSNSTQLWTMGNYHWYLKQEIKIQLPLANCPLVWHPERMLQFASLSSGNIHMVEFILHTARGSLNPPHDAGVTAVLDGQVVRLTPFKTANIPPPMALHEIEVATNAIDVAFNEDASLIAILHHKGVSLFEWESTSAASKEPLLTGQITFEKLDSGLGNYQQVVFAANGQIVALQRELNGDIVKQFGFNDDTGRMEELYLLSSSISRIAAVSNYSQDDTLTVLTQGYDGELQNLGPGDNKIQHSNLKMYLPWLELIPYGTGQIAFGMTAHGQLYANSRQLVKNCTSFVVTPSHLIFTTTTHFLKFVHIVDVDELEIPADDPEKDERCRSIERGARLVTAMPTALSVVLQMPRGNLETIFPRAMVLAGIRKLIDEKNYRKAFTHCRTQRVDMNILYDHNPAQFLSNVALFVDQVKKISYIDLFLSSLREEDVTQVMYKETKLQQNPSNNTSLPIGAVLATSVEGSLLQISKVNRICDAVLEVLQSRRSTNLQNIITANVSKQPPALDDGLIVVAELMKDNQTLADKAVEHICFLADVNKLYDNALGLYDLELALLVAQQSQKDPREYLPFMQNLQQQTETRRRYNIDDYLGRHNKALKHLHTLDAFEELQGYTQKHTLYQAALALYRYNPDQHAHLTNLYAEHLESKAKYKDAALAFSSLQNYNKATSCYLASGPSQWRETLFSALSQSPPLAESAVTDLATSLHDGLIESKDYYPAALIQLDYLSSTIGAARAFCKGYYFSDALHLIALKNKRELLEEVVDPGLGDAFASSTELLSDMKAQLLAQVPRIRELRLKAIQDPLAFYEGERGGGDGDIPDDVSVAASSRLSTNRSMFTRYTGKAGSVGTVGTGVSRATSKNRKREERKRARGKKGSVYEEEYLVNSVERLINRVESSRGEVERLVDGLIRRSMWERARSVESALAEVVKMCQDCVGEVFGSDEKKKEEEEKQVGDEEVRAVGADAVFQESMEAAGKKREVPVIKAFEKLSLLGT